MAEFNTKQIRNLALLGHGGCGKTSVAEAMLYVTGAIDRLGNTAQGNTTCDYDPEARARGAIGLFGNKYGERVKVYTMGDYSCEICGGPHAANTGDLGTFKIKKEEASSAGVRRIKAVLIPKEEKKD